MTRMRHPFFVAGLMLASLGATSPAAMAATHSFVLTYRSFGPVQTGGTFQSGASYAVRPEGCYAKHSDEAICGFTLRATRALTVSNVANASQGSGGDGSTLRTCCMFVQGDDRGYPITTATQAPPGLAVLSHPLSPGQQVGLMLRVPNYKKAAPLTAITFSAGRGDPGVSFATRVIELP